MQQDKALLCYHGKPQVAHLFEMLHTFFNKVYVSCRQDQVTQFEGAYPLVVDAFGDIGPMGGLLSFFKKNPQKACLVLACDLPFLNRATIQYLLDHFLSHKIATVFKNPKTGSAEPLVAIWTPASIPFLKKAAAAKKYSLQTILQQQEAHLIAAPFPQDLQNVNTPAEYELAVRQLGDGKVDMEF